MDKEFILIQDNDGHWYVIPADKTDDWFKWEESQDYQDGIVPEYAEEVGGCYTRVKFKDYKIG